MASTSSSSSNSVPTDLVCELLRKPFSARLLDSDQCRILAIRLIKNKGRGFQAMWYTKKKWLCASESWKKLFCWPCLLFCPGSSTTWTKNGYNNMQGFLCDCKKHEKAKSHMDAFKTWQTFTQTERVDVMLSHARREEIWRHNEQVRQNREILKL